MAFEKRLDGVRFKEIGSKHAEGGIWKRKKVVRLKEQGVWSMV
jgi:hypothetical protein